MILSTADVIKNTGLRDLGYYYIILDDCWSSGRTSSGQLIADAKKFPNGMKYLGDQLHAEGFGFGVYSSAGTKTVRTPFSKLRVIAGGIGLCALALYHDVHVSPMPCYSVLDTPQVWAWRRPTQTRSPAGELII